MSRADGFNKWVHPKTREDDYRTPAFVLRYVSDLMGRPITHDGACSPDNAVSLPFDLFSNEQLPEDSLLFVNPPWDTPNVKRFVEAAHRKTPESSDCVFLLPNKLSEVGWVLDVNWRFSEIIMLGGRLDFTGPHSVKKGASRWGTFLGVLKTFGNPNNDTRFHSIRIKTLKEEYP